MRIISGKWRGKRITAPNNLPTRPTTDMHKEALFNVLQNYYNFDQVSVLDLFTGIGNVAYEFASRGSLQITAVDQHSGCVKFIEKTIDQMQMPIQVIQQDVFVFLNRKRKSYDIVFADPPYNITLENLEKIHTLVFENKYLTEVGMLVIEHTSDMKLAYLPHFSFEKKYGGTTFSFFEV
jgi:16S rRNA (guanine(966)-N(2))-methyltransferase RsmD